MRLLVPVVSTAAVVALLSFWFRAGPLEAGLRLIYGFVPFLWRNFQKISFCVDTLAPGLVAFLLVSVMLHFPLRSVAQRNGKPWGWRATLAVSLALPALFGISFLVPGILVQFRP